MSQVPTNLSHDDHQQKDDELNTDATSPAYTGNDAQDRNDPALTRLPPSRMTPGNVFAQGNTSNASAFGSAAERNQRMDEKRTHVAPSALPQNTGLTTTPPGEPYSNLMDDWNHAHANNSHQTIDDRSPAETQPLPDTNVLGHSTLDEALVLQAYQDVDFVTTMEKQFWTNVAMSPSDPLVQKLRQFAEDGAITTIRLASIEDNPTIDMNSMAYGMMYIGILKTLVKSIMSKSPHLRPNTSSPTPPTPPPKSPITKTSTPGTSKSHHYKSVRIESPQPDLYAELGSAQKPNESNVEFGRRMQAYARHMSIPKTETTTEGITIPGAPTSTSEGTQTSAPVPVHFAAQPTPSPKSKMTADGKYPLQTDWDNRVAMQRMRNADLSEKKGSLYDDQGIRFEGPTMSPYDHMAREYAYQTTQGNPSREPKPVDNRRVAASAPNPGDPDDGDDDDDDYGGPNDPPKFGANRTPGGGGREPPKPPPKDNYWDQPDRNRATPGVAYPRGITAPPSSRYRNSTPGMTEASESYHQTMHSRLRTLIHEKLAVRMKIPEGTKLRRLDSKSVGLYKGGKTFNELEEWLTNLLLYLQASQYGGSDRDAECVTAISEFLEGTPKTWYNRNTQHVLRQQVHWTFEQVIIGLYNRFVHASSMQDARLAFDKAKYDPSEGVAEFHETLLTHASNMSIYPDSYSIMIRFLEGLPSSMTDKMLMEGYNPEVHTVDDFLAEALALETAYTTVKNFSRTRVPKASPVASKEPSKAQAKYEQDQAGPAMKKIGTTFIKKSEAMNPDGTFRTLYRPKGNGQPARVYTPAHRPSANAPRRSTPAPRPTNKNCFNCDKPGHFKRECPEPLREQLRAAHSVVDDNEDPHEDDQVDEPDFPVVDDNDADATYVEFDINEHYEREDDDEFLHAMLDLPEPAEKDHLPEPYLVDDTTVIFTCNDPRYVAEDMRAMTELPSPPPNFAKLRKVQLRLEGKPRERPTIPQEMKECLATYVKVGDSEAWTLWDSGSTTTGMSPAYAEVANLSAFPLVKPIILQLGTIGSRATVNYGAEVNINIPGCDTLEYVDIANFDRYDMIIGTPFMRRNKVHLDFENNEVVVNGVRTKATRLQLADTDGRLRRHRVIEKAKDI